jgi:hypothetical protein
MTKIELKNIKYAAFASEETNCYEATLYVDGKRFAKVSNQGHGGCDMQHPIEPFTNKDLAKLEETIAKEYPKWGSEYGDGEEYDTNLEIVCGGLLNQWHIDKDIKKSLKKILYVRSDGDKDVWSMSNAAGAKHHGDKIRQKIKGKFPHAIILNDLPIEEVRPYFS